MNLFLLYLLSPQTRKDKATSMSLVQTLLNEKSYLRNGFKNQPVCHLTQKYSTDFTSRSV